MRGPFLAALALLSVSLACIPSVTHAGLGTCLRDWFSSASSRLVTLNPVEMEVWRRTFHGAEPPFPYISILRMSDEDPIFWFAYRNLPSEILERLSAAPLDYEEAKKFFASLYSYVGQSSFLDLVQQRWMDSLMFRKPASFAQWQREGLELLETTHAVNPSFYAETEARWNGLVKLEHSSRFWRKAGVQKLLLRTAPRGREILIGKNSFPVHRDGSAWIAEVPREILAHRFDNPVSTKKLIQMSEMRVRPPSAYAVDVGLDGRMYITDGNHRFELDPRKVVKVRLADPPSTVSLPVMLDFLGARQPAREAVLRFRNGEITLEELLGSENQRVLKRMTLLPLQLPLSP